MGGGGQEETGGIASEEVAYCPAMSFVLVGCLLLFCQKKGIHKANKSSWPINFWGGGGVHKMRAKVFKSIFNSL